MSQVSQILGHKTPELTLKVYTHWFASASSASAMADLAAAIRRPEVNPTGRKTVADGAVEEVAISK